MHPVIESAKIIYNDLNDQIIFYKAHLAKSSIQYATLDVLQAITNLKNSRNYIVLRDFTQDSDLPWEYNGQTWLIENELTPSPDHCIAKLIIGYWGKNAYRFENLDFSRVSANAEAIIFWYNYPYEGISHTEFTVHAANKSAIICPQIIRFDNCTISYSATDKVTWDGKTGYYAPLQDQGFVVITADSLSEVGMKIQDIVKISAFAQGVEPWPFAATYWYVDDIGVIKSIQSFKDSLESITKGCL